MNKLIESLLEHIYPSSLYCISCEKLIDKDTTYSLCSHCMQHIRWQNSLLENESGIGNTKNRVEVFIGEDIQYVKNIYVCTQYGLYEQSLIFSLKYRGNTYIASYMGQMLADKLKLEGVLYDYVLEVPLNTKKYNARGFNQSELIAKHLCDNMSEFGFVHMKNALNRKRPTIPMRGLTKMQRVDNVRDVFEVSQKRSEKIKDSNVLLIDDILTTGSTVNECARTLHNAGAKNVDVLVFASGNVDYIDVKDSNCEIDHVRKLSESFRNKIEGKWLT